MTTHFVYEFYGENGPLYVGYTASMSRRIADHILKPWWSEVTRLEANTYPDADSGRLAEQERIRILDPIYNTQFTDRMPDGWQTRRADQAATHARGEMCARGCRECKAKREARLLAARAREPWLYQRKKKLVGGHVGGAAPTPGEMR